MKLRDRVLHLFEDDVASALVEFGKSLSKLDADIVVFLARKSLCLYDVLLKLGVPPSKDVWLATACWTCALIRFAASA